MFKNVKKYLSFLLAIAMIATIIPANLAFASTAENGTALTDRSGIAADIRFALFGDTHVTAFPDAASDWTSPSVALDGIMDAYYTIDPAMDAFVMPGDVIYNVAPSSEKTSDDEVKYAAVLAEINEEYPDASPATNIVWSMGNHEITLGANKGTATTNFVNGSWDAEVADNHARYKNALGRDPIDTYEVNGYTFVTSAPYDYLNNYVNPNDKTVISEYETKIKGYLEAALAKDATKPVFYLQHEAIDATNIASSSTIPTRNSAAFREFVVSNPRIITLSGHSHYAANDPRTFLQLDNGSTHINIPATRGAASTYSTTKDSVTDNAIATQGMLVEVTGAEVTVRRFDYVDKKYIGEPYVFTAGAAAKTEYTKVGREAAKTSEVNKAYFANGAAITVSNIKSNTAKISFPEGLKDGESATGLQDSYIHYYRVKIVNKATGNIVKSYSLLGNYHINSTDKVNYSDSKYPALRKSLDREISIDGLLRNTTYTVTVTPESALGQQGTPLTTEFTTSADKTAAELALTQKFTNNVALGKTVTGTLGTADMHPGFVDGKKSTSTPGDVYGTFAKDSYITVDLGKQYAVNKVVLTVPGGSNNAKQGYSLDISSDPSFPDDATKTRNLSSRGLVGSMSEATEFVNGTTLTVELDGTKSYRYVRYLKTAEHYSYLSELEVYADEYMTDVSKNATATASNSYTSHPASYVLDGVVSETKSWWSGWNSKYNWVQIDLGASLPVSMIQVDAGPDTGTDNFTDSASQEKWRVYGSNTVATEAELLNSSTITAEGYKQLAYTAYLPKYDATGTVHSLNKGSSAAASDTGIARSKFDGTLYQYITLKHATVNFAAIGEVTIWAKNPHLNSAVKTDEGIVLNFSEVMNSSTVNSENIKVYDANGAEITGTTFTPSADGYSATITGADDALRVELTYAVMSQDGMELAGDLVKYFESNIDLSGKPVTIERGVNVSKGKTVTAYNMELTTGTTSWNNLVDGNETSCIYVNSNKDGDGNTNTSEAYIQIDLGARYSINKIVYTLVEGSQAKQQFDIRLSNDVNFNTHYDQVYTIGGLQNVDTQSDFVDNKLTLNLENKNYRYVRINRKTYAWMQMNEFAVYADRNLMEVSRGVMPTVSNTYAGYSVKGLTDGVNNSKTGGWASGWNDQPEWINLDLGAVFSLARVELESVYNGKGDSDYNSRRYWNIYGSNITPTAEDLNTTTADGANNMISAEGYTLLDTTSYGCMPSYNEGVFDEQVYYTTADVISKWNSGSYGKENGILRSDISGNYRYLTLQNGYGNYANMGEIRAYIVAPKANAAVLAGDEVSISFSEEIFPTYLTSDYITLYDSNNNVVAYSNGTVTDNYTFTFTADLIHGETYKVVVDKAVKAVTSIPLGIDNELTFTVPSISSAVTVKDADSETVTEFVADSTYSFDVAVTSPFSAGTAVRVVVAQYDGDKLVKAELADATAAANTTTTVNVAGFTYATDNTFKVYVWDNSTQTPFCAEIILPAAE